MSSELASARTKATGPDENYSRNAILFTPEGAFDRGLSDVPPYIFTDEQKSALAPDCPTGLIALDLGPQLGLPWPATTPIMLARYVIVRTGESLAHRFEATGEIFYVIRGAGSSSAGDTRIEWQYGDVFCLPGASRTLHRASADSVLLCVTNEPELAYARVPAPDVSQNAAITPAFFSGRKIDEALGVVHSRSGPQQTAGKSVLLATTPLAHMKSLLPSLTAAMNTLEAGGDQRSHQHNAAALTLSIQGQGVYSKVGGQRIDWIPFGVIVTPPQAMHSHHNRGDGMMKSFVIQDGALYYHCRNAGFRWETDSAAPTSV
jgi:gentisate 1,2-dioxygenase